MLKNWIPYASEVEKMGQHPEPLIAYAPRCVSVVAYQALWEEINQTCVE